MKALYGFTRLGTEFFYIPFHLIGFQSRKDFVFRIDPNIIKRIDNLLSNIDYSTKIVREKGWDVVEVDVDDSQLEDLRDACFKSNNKNEINKIAEKIFICVQEEAAQLGPLEVVVDSLDDWWLSGERPFGEASY